MVEQRVGGRLLVVVVAAMLVGAHARAAVVQTDGTTLPQPVNDLERSLIADSWGWNPLTQSPKDASGNLVSEPIVFGEYYSPPAFPQFAEDDAITLAGLFKWRSEAIDWQADATAPVGAFVPYCPITVEPVLAGGDCDMRLTWYNVDDPPSAQPPSASELYDVLPSELAAFADCHDAVGNRKTDGFCPLAWDNRNPRDLSMQEWTPRQVTLDVARDPRYGGGAIGFAVVPIVAGQYCTDTHYSVRAHNVTDASGQPYVSSLVYPSRLDPGAMYVAFEDGTMLPNDWTNSRKTDGDYNDYVIYVSGCFDGHVDRGQGGAGGASYGDAGAPTDAGTPGTANQGGDTANRGGDTANQGGSSGAHSAAGSTTDEELAGQGAGTSTEKGASGEHSTAHGGTGTTTTTSGGCGCHIGEGRSAASLLFAGLLALGALRRRR